MPDGGRGLNAPLDSAREIRTVRSSSSSSFLRRKELRRRLRPAEPYEPAANEKGTREKRFRKEADGRRGIGAGIQGWRHPLIQSERGAEGRRAQAAALRLQALRKVHPLKSQGRFLQALPGLCDDRSAGLRVGSDSVQQLWVGRT